MTESERRYVDLTERVEKLEKENKRLENELRKAKFETGEAMSEVVRVRRCADIIDEEKHELLVQMAQLSMELRKAKRWLKIYRKEV